MAASCLHEGFLLATPMENIKKLQMAMCELLEEDNKDIILAILPHMHTLIKSYSNEHTIIQVPDPTPTDETTPTKGFGLAHSNTFGGKMNDFPTVSRKYDVNPKSSGYKKLTSMNVGALVSEVPEELSSSETYLISSDFKSEIVY